MISPKMYAEIQKMNADDLRQLNSYVVSILKEHRAEKVYDVKRKLRVGDNVKVDSPRVYGLTGSVLEIKRTRCKVKFGYQTFNVPLSMVQMVK